MDEKLLRDMQPFWNSWYIDGVIGEGSYGSVYRIVREEFGQKYYSALKIISTPKNKSELKQALVEGMTEKDAQEYFKSKAEEIYKEIIMMAKLKGKSSIVSYEDHQVVERKNGDIGYDILIRMELLKGLNDYVMRQGLSIPEIVRMGKEICQGLVLCQNNGIMHRDIKPDNIFITKDGEFKLGDFGIAKKMESLEHGFTIRGTYEYMAPEVYHGEKYDSRVDIYSLGIVLYMFLNNKKTPFLPTDTNRINHNMRQEAIRQRFAGEQIKTPMLAGEELSYVIMKAISYEPDNRYQTAKDFLSALEAITEKDMAPFEGDWEEKDKKVLKRLEDERKAGKEPVKAAQTEPVSDDEDLDNTVELENKKAAEENSKEADFEEGTVQQEKKDAAAPEEGSKSKSDAEGEEKSEESKPEEGKAGGTQPDAEDKGKAGESKQEAGKAGGTQLKTEGKAKAGENKQEAGKAGGTQPETEGKVKAGESKQETGKAGGTQPDARDNNGEAKLADIDLEPVNLLGNKPEKKGAILNPEKMGQPKKKKAGNNTIIITLAGLAVVIAIVVIVLLQSKPDSDQEETGMSPDVVATVSSPEPEESLAPEPSESPQSEPEQEDKESGDEPSAEPSSEPEEPEETPVPDPITDFPDANSSELKDITELENYQYAVSINVINNKIKDLTPLADCIYLEKLNASYNRVSDITALSELTDLEELDLIHNAISDISSLSGLTKLKSLKLADNNISDLEPLSGLVNLKELDISNNSEITDITPLLGLKKLKNVYILGLEKLDEKQVRELRKLVEGNGGMLFE